MEKMIIPCMNCGKHNIAFLKEAPTRCPGCKTYNLPCIVCKNEKCDMSTYEDICPYTKKKNK